MVKTYFTLTLDELQSRYQYIDGCLIYKIDRGTRVKAGSIVGSVSTDGYARTQVNSKAVLIHRLIFLLHHGYLPQVVDHIDSNIKNNKIENLRPATMRENAMNRKISRANTSGYKGIHWQKSVNRWRAECDGNYLGLYGTIEEAQNCLKNYREINHKEFLNDGKYCAN